MWLEREEQRADRRGLSLIDWLGARAGRHTEIACWIQRSLLARGVQS